LSDPIKSAGERIKSWMLRLQQASRSRRVRKWGLIVVAVVAGLGVALAIAVPPILRHVLTVQVAASLHRPVSVGRIGFNPVNLRLDVDE
jgi:hypothetical protein